MLLKADALHLSTSSNLLWHLLQSQPTLTKAGLAVGAVAAAGVFLVNEVEVVLELLGVAAAGNFLAKKVLFAKDRQQTVGQIRCLACRALLHLHHQPQSSSV